MRTLWAKARRTARYWVRILKALAVDPRLPWPVRWTFRVALAIKCVPLPDFGVDEALLLVGGVLLATVYRPVWRQIKAEAKA